MSINIPLLMAHLTGALAKSGLPAHRLEIELTGTAMVEGAQQVTRTLRAIKALGVKIATDDFGTGYSAPVHLRDFPLDRIKVDVASSPLPKPTVTQWLFARHYPDRLTRFPGTLRHVGGNLAPSLQPCQENGGSHRAFDESAQVVPRTATISIGVGSSLR